MGLVHITGGATLLDDEDEWLLEIGTWFISEGRVRGYVVSSYKMERLHHYIVGFPVFGFEVDHVNGNALDNRRRNLEHVRHAENVARWGATTKGYYWDKSRSRWQVSITVNYKRINGGRYVDEVAAAQAAKNLRAQLRGA